MSEEGVTLHRLPREWKRESPGFPVSTIERAYIPEPVGAVYQLTGEVFERILRAAGWEPITEPTVQGHADGSDDA